MLHILFQVSVVIAIATAKVNTPTKILNDGHKIPTLCFGTFGKASDIEALVKPSVIQAIEAGYRHVDTAAMYQNEVQVGEAIADVIRRGIVTREDIYVTTKVNIMIKNREEVLPGTLAALDRLKLDYIDLLLIHIPYNNEENNAVIDYVSIWKGLEDVKKLNLTRSIGVSNFEINHLNDIINSAEIIPAVNQIEVHPSFTNIELVEYCQRLNIMVLSYAPFGWMVPRPFIYNPTTITFNEPVLVRIAKKYGKTTSQVAIRYLIDRGTIPIPRSQNMERIKLNADVFDFSLTAKEIASINGLNGNNKAYDVGCRSIMNAIGHYFGL